MVEPAHVSPAHWLVYSTGPEFFKKRKKIDYILGASMWKNSQNNQWFLTGWKKLGQNSSIFHEILAKSYFYLAKFFLNWLKMFFNQLEKFFNRLFFFQPVKNHWLFQPVFSHGRSQYLFLHFNNHSDNLFS